MKTLEIKISSDALMQELGYKLTFAMYPNLVLALTGDLGAGKTTFTKGIGRALEIKRVINSPTFTIMKIYDAMKQVNGIEKLYHLDVYRLNNAADDFELEEYFFQNGVSIVEWADIIKEILPDTIWKMDIKRSSEDSRIVRLSVLDSDFENVKKALEGVKYEIIY